MQVALKSCGNPDHGQDPDRPYFLSYPDRIVNVSSYAEASKACLKFIRDGDLGRGNWSGGQIFIDGKCVAEVDCVGRVHALDGTKIPIE